MSDEKIEQNDLVFKATIEVYYRPLPKFAEEFRGYEGPEQAEFLTYMKNELKEGVVNKFGSQDEYQIEIDITEVPEWPK